MGENIASTEGTITALDGAYIRHEEVTNATRAKLAIVVGPLTTATEMGTHTYILHSLLWMSCPVVEAILPLVNWIRRNRTEWVRLMEEQETTTRFSSDVSGILAVYLNTCIGASTALEAGGGQGRAHRYPSRV